jgi:hypothetical protein
MTTEQEVITVLSSELAPRLDELALSVPVWVVRTAATEEAARRIWEKHPPQETDQLTSGLTLFKGEGDAEDDLLSILDEVELHHGSSGGHVPPMSAIRVLGTGPTDAVRKALGSLGFARLVWLQTGSSPIGMGMWGSTAARSGRADFSWT